MYLSKIFSQRCTLSISRCTFTSIRATDLNINYNKSVALLEEGFKKWQEKEFVTAVELFNRVEAETVSDKHKLVDMYCKKAQVYQMGRQGDEYIALDCLNKALELDPKSLLAKSMRSAILAEYDIS